MDKIIYLLKEEVKENEIGDIIRSMEKNKRYADVNDEKIELTCTAKVNNEVKCYGT